MCSNTSTSTIEQRAFSDLKGYTFQIPYQQRGYKWKGDNVEELLNDLRAFIRDVDEKKRVYCLQPLAVVKLDTLKFSVIDGQQRLTTLYLLYSYLMGEAPYRFEFERDERADQSDNQGSRSAFLENISSKSETDAEANIDYFFIYRAYHKIHEVFSRWAEEAEKSDQYSGQVPDYRELFTTLLNAGKDDKCIQFLWYEVDQKDEYKVFRNLNSGKISLNNTELIKALLLNRVSGLPQHERMEAAVQFEFIERELQNDHFWYMFNSEEPFRERTRMDMLFNLVAKGKPIDYENDSRWSFRNYFAQSSDGVSLSEKWQQVRYLFLQLMDLYNDIYFYHYIGFLTYCREGSHLSQLNTYLEAYKTLPHSEFKKFLQRKIRSILNKGYASVDDYTYFAPKKDLRKLFLMHNIETILQRFEKLHSSQTLRLQHEFEQFPFELLHKQSWDIEHIESNTDCDFDNARDREDWWKCVNEDLGEEFMSKNGFLTLYADTYAKTKKKEHFDAIYKGVMLCYEKKLWEESKDVIYDKMQVGNLTLLDSHTNRSYAVL